MYVYIYILNIYIYIYIYIIYIYIYTQLTVLQLDCSWIDWIANRLLHLWPVAAYCPDSVFPTLWFRWLMEVMEEPAATACRQVNTESETQSRGNR